MDIKQEWFLFKSRFDKGVGRTFNDYELDGQQYYKRISFSLTPLDRLQIRLFGRKKVGEMRLFNWTGSLPVYAFHCKKHGYYIDYLRGYCSADSIHTDIMWNKGGWMYADCPECLKESVDNLSPLEKYIVMLLGANQSEPIPSLTHLKAELILCAKLDPELQKYIDEHGGIKL